VITLLDKTTQVATTIGVILNQKNSHGLRKKLSPFHRPLRATVTAPENGRMARLQVPLEQDDCQSMRRFAKFSFLDGPLDLYPGRPISCVDLPVC
jgi:hypothetical protein